VNGIETNIFLDYLALRLLYGIIFLRNKMEEVYVLVSLFNAIAPELLFWAASGT
jgi:hypothetical protein